MYPPILAAFHSILEYSGDKAPRQTMQAWVEFAKEWASGDLKMPISTFDFLDIDLSIQLAQLDVEESFFRLYDLGNKQGEAHKIACVRLALSAIVGEERQRQWVEKFNERIAPWKAELKRQPDMSDLQLAPSYFEKGIVDAIDHMFKEASVCYENKCYRAAIMLCRNVIETLIKNVYKPVTGKEIYTTNKKGEQIERSFNNMCNDLRAENLLNRGVSELLDLIYAHRSGATHETLIPNENEAQAIHMLTKNVMNRIFEYFNSRPQ